MRGISMYLNANCLQYLESNKHIHVIAYLSIAVSFN